jgi:UPF0271 protein
VNVGAHFSFPDLQGFGRREMKIEREELANIITYQVGALVGFLDMAGMKLSHLKPHGALYGMAAKQVPIAQAVADVGVHYKVPVYGMASTLHEEIYTARGLEFRAEFYADLYYDDDGGLIITREHQAVDPQDAAARSLRVDIAVKAEVVCVHSDTPNAIDVAKAVFEILAPHRHTAG